MTRSEPDADTNSPLSVEELDAYSSSVYHCLQTGQRFHKTLTTDLDKIITLARRSIQAAGGWRDISTAPKDGRVILLYEHGEWLVGFWFDGRWLQGETCNSAIENKPNPTHWQPLPAPPPPAQAEDWIPEICELSHQELADELRKQYDIMASHDIDIPILIDAANALEEAPSLPQDVAGEPTSKPLEEQEREPVDENFLRHTGYARPGKDAPAQSAAPDFDLVTPQESFYAPGYGNIQWPKPSPSPAPNSETSEEQQWLENMKRQAPEIDAEEVAFFDELKRAAPNSEGLVARLKAFRGADKLEWYLKAWDRMRGYIADGGGGDWPRLCLESWIEDWFDHAEEAAVALERAERENERLRNGLAKTTEYYSNRVSTQDATIARLKALVSPTKEAG
jgi:hypothetical protein